MDERIAIRRTAFEQKFSDNREYSGVRLFGNVLRYYLRRDGPMSTASHAVGNSTASVMGRTYPGAGASISPSFIFGWIAARHAIGQTIN